MLRNDIEILKFIKMLDELAKKSKNGIKSFNEVTIDNFENYIFYDPKSENNGIFKIVLDACLIEHHDIVSYYDNYCGKDYLIYVKSINNKLSVGIVL